MREGDSPPVGFSVYASRRSMTSELEPWTQTKTHLLLPDVVTVGPHEIRFMAREVGIRGIDVKRPGIGDCSDVPPVS